MANDFVHCELSTTNVEKAAGFYKQMFKWKISKYPGMDYLGVDTGAKKSGGGIQQLPMPEAPTAWMPYVGVKDVKKSLARAKKLGAQIVQPFTAIGDAGAIGIFLDPTGAALGVYEPAKKGKEKKKKKKKK
ncbi:MAG: 1,4-alpha-glucan (glycogen) branching enzyme, GH3-type [Myxococcaceae bacterium]|nr:1,4-alpha-glucan (glycogen) branching enzyme, GH3-type [Myxococcaceae bacterium]